MNREVPAYCLVNLHRERQDVGRYQLQIQFLGKADTVQFTANFTTFAQPLFQRATLKGDMNHFHIMQF